MRARRRCAALSAAAVLAWSAQLHPAQASAGDARTTDLLGIVEDTLAHDATLAAARDAERAAQQAVPKARAALLPRIDAGWGRQYNGIATRGYPGVHYWQNGWTVVLTQPVFDWAHWSAFRQAGDVAARGELEAARARQDAILRAAQAYFDVLSAADEATRAEAWLRALDAHAALLARARAAGETTLVDQRETEASQARAQLQWLDALDRQRLARMSLERLTAKPASTLAAPAEGAPLPTLAPAAMAAWVAQAQSRGFPVQVGEVALQIAKRETEKARAAHYPSVDLQVTHTPAGAGGGYALPTTTTTAMLAVTIPLFAGGGVSAQVSEARALEDKARDELEAAVRESGGAAREDWLRVTSGRTRVEALQRLVGAAQAALEATKIGFAVGSRASVDVLRATDDFYASRRDLVRARHDMLLALLGLLADTASLDLDAVRRINEQLLHGEQAAGMQPAARADALTPASPPPPSMPPPY